MDAIDNKGNNCPYPQNREECLVELAQLKSSVTKWNLILEDIYKAIVGDIHGNIGLQPKVKKLEEELELIKERLVKIEEFVSNSPPRQSVKQAVEKVGEFDRILHEIKPETADIHDKKMIVKGGLIVIGSLTGIMAFLTWLHKYIVPFFKSGNP